MVISIGDEADCSNIAFALVVNEKIANVIDPNDPEPDPPEEDPIISNSTETKAQFYIPQEYTTGGLVVLGIVVGIPITVVLLRRKKNVGGL